MAEEKNEQKDEQKECNCSKEEKCDCNDCNCACNEEKTPNYLEDLLRLQAEFDNYRKRTIKSLDNAKQEGFIQAITGVIPALDSFKKANEFIKDKDTLKGVHLIEKELSRSLENLGVKKISCKGEFDPNLHNAIAIDEKSDVPSGHIVKELTAGYTYEDKVVRFAQVIVRK